MKVFNLGFMDRLLGPEIGGRFTLWSCMCNTLWYTAFIRFSKESAPFKVRSYCLRGPLL